MINILICGATGFIGRNLLNVLSKNKNYQIHAVFHKQRIFDVPDAHNKIIWHQADLRNIDSLPALLNNKDIVIQAAATTSGSKDIVNSPYLHVTDNAIMNSLLLRQSMESKVKHFIFFSCTVMYQNSSTPVKESDWDANKEIYNKYFGVANTKIYIEKMLEFYSGISAMKTTAIRHSNIYGPFDKFDFERSHVFGATISKTLKANKDILIWGNGEEERDLLYIDDLIAFVQNVIDNQVNKFRIYNCGSCMKISIKNLVNKIIKESKKDLEIKYDLSKPTIKTSLLLNCNLAEKEIGWKPRVSLDEGIKRTISWWKRNIDPNTLHLKD